MIGMTAVATREPALFALRAPTIWITIAVYHDDCGEEHVAIARIAAWHEQDACAYLEDRILEDVFGVPAEEARAAWERDDGEDSDRLWISELVAFSTEELNGKRPKGHGRAVVAVARHLAEATYGMWQKEEAYREPEAVTADCLVHPRASARYVLSEQPELVG